MVGPSLSLVIPAGDLNQILTFPGVFFKLHTLDWEQTGTASHWAAPTTYHNIDTTMRGKRST